MGPLLRPKSPERQLKPSQKGLKSGSQGPRPQIWGLGAQIALFIGTPDMGIPGLDEVYRGWALKTGVWGLGQGPRAPSPCDPSGRYGE